MPPPRGEAPLTVPVLRFLGSSFFLQIAPLFSGASGHPEGGEAMQWVPPCHPCGCPERRCSGKGGQGFRRCWCVPQIRGCGLPGHTALPTPTGPQVSSCFWYPSYSLARPQATFWANCCCTQLEIVPSEVWAALPSWRLCKTFLPGQQYL